MTAAVRPGSLHPEAPRREDPHLQGRARRRAQAGHGAVRRPQGLDGAARRPRPRGGAQAPRSGPRAHDGGRAPLRGHRQPGHGRRDHGAVRRAARARGPRGARLLRGAADAGVGEAVRARRCAARTACRCRSASASTRARSSCAPIGSDLHMDYTAVGQTTHLAARMEQLAMPGTDPARPPRPLRLAEGYVEVKSLGPVPVKGLPEPVEVFELTGAGHGAHAPAGRGARGASRASSAATPRSSTCAGCSAKPTPATARWSPSSARPGWASRGWSTSSPTRIGCRTG